MKTIEQAYVMSYDNERLDNQLKSIEILQNLYGSDKSLEDVLKESNLVGTYQHRVWVEKLMLNYNHAKTLADCKAMNRAAYDEVNI